MILKENKTYTLELSAKELEVIQILLRYCTLHDNKHVWKVSKVLDETDNEYDFSKLTYKICVVDGLSISIKE